MERADRAGPAHAIRRLTSSRVTSARTVRPYLKTAFAPDRHSSCLDPGGRAPDLDVFLEPRFGELGCGLSRRGTKLSVRPQNANGGGSLTIRLAFRKR